MNIELIKQFQFEAAHTTNGRLHGHSYIVEIKCEGECDEVLGWLLDYGEISEQFEPLYQQLDHHTLDDVAGMLESTVPGIEAWLNAHLSIQVPYFHSVRVRIAGDCAFHTRVIEEPDVFGEPPRVRFGFEAAHFLPNVPETHKCRRMHGHSFRVEVAARDLAPLESALRGIYDELDHSCLNKIDGLDNATSEQVARWIWEQLTARGADKLISVTVAETCTARCVYRGL